MDLCNCTPTNKWLGVLAMDCPTCVAKVEREEDGEN